MSAQLAHKMSRYGESIETADDLADELERVAVHLRERQSEGEAPAVGAALLVLAHRARDLNVDYHQSRRVKA